MDFQYSININIFYCNKDKNGVICYMEEKIYTCPECGSNNVRQMSKFRVISTLLIIAGLFFLLSYYLKYLWIGTALFLLFAFASLFNRGMLRCKECDKAWKLE